MSVISSAEPERGAKVAPSEANTASTESRQPQDTGADIVLLMDSSGSMKKTDPNNYRKDAARLFISLLGADDRVGVMSFGDSAKTLITLTQNSGKNRADFIKAIGKITSRELTTDITGAVKQGVSELATSKRKNRYLIIMSDGKLDLGDSEKEKASLAELMRLLPEIKGMGIKLFSIAFSELSDKEMLSDMAEKTGGFFRYAAADKDIHLMFASLFEKIKSPDSVALEGDSFNIDKDVKEAVLLITKKPGTATLLFDPTGTKIAQGNPGRNVQWYSSNVFDMITVQEPVAGKWKVQLSSQEGNKIFVLTDLKLKSSFDRNTLNIGDKAVIDAWLEKEDKRITDNGILSQIVFSAEIIGPDGRGLKIPLSAREGADAGVYSTSLNINQGGNYTVRLSVEGKTFNRTKDILFKAVEPMPSAEPASQTHETIKHSDEAEYIVDWRIVALILAAVTILLMAVLIYLLLTARKYRKLYDSSHSKASISQDEVTAAKPIPNAEVVAGDVTTSQDITSENQDRDIATETAPAANNEMPPVLSASEVSTEIDKEGPQADLSRIERLLDIIEFQKNKIAELMFVKDTFENARIRLSALQARNRLMQDKARSIAESHGIAKEFDEPLAALEDDASELVSYILVFEKEENRLSEKFQQWEDELSRLMSGEDNIKFARMADSPEASARIAELEVKLKETEEQLAAKVRQLQDLEKQHEDIEKEYMILYQQSQKQQQPEV